MAVDFMFERLLSRPVDMSKDPAENKITLLFKAGQTDNEQEVMTAADNNLPAQWIMGIFKLKLQGYNYHYEGNGWWHVEAHYARRDFFDPEIRINTTGGTHHITSSLGTVLKIAVDPAKEPPDYKGAIGVDGQTVHGCDIHTPVWEWEETYIKTTAQVTWAYLGDLWFLTGRINHAIFRIFGPKEVLFLGAQGAVRGSDYWQFTYRFAASKSDPLTPIGNTGKTIAKTGWEFLWMQFADLADAAGKVIRQPVYAYTENVYKEGDFSKLLLPVDPLPIPPPGMMAEGPRVSMEEARAALDALVREGGV